MSTAIEILRKIDKVTVSGDNSADRLAQLDEIYALTVQRAECDIQWYQTRKTRYRKLSRLNRVVTFILLFIGTLIPLGLFEVLCSVKEGAGGDKLGYIILAAAGLFYSCDKMFLLSKGWMRYLATEMDIKELILAYRYDWKIARIELEQADEDKRAALEVAALESFKAFILAVHDLVEKETETWAEDFKTAISSMGKRLKAKEEQYDKKIEAAEKRAQAGALLVTVETDKVQDGEIKVSIAGEKQDEETVTAPKGSCSFVGLVPGYYKVEATTEVGGETLKLASDIVEVSPGKKAALKMVAISKAVLEGK